MIEFLRVQLLEADVEAFQIFEKQIPVVHRSVPKV